MPYRIRVYSGDDLLEEIISEQSSLSRDLTYTYKSCKAVVDFGDWDACDEWVPFELTETYEIRGLTRD